MKRASGRYAIAAAAAALLVLLAGLVLAGPAGRGGVAVGAAAAFVFQAAGFWLFAERLFPGRPALVYVLGMLGRFVLVGLVAFVALPLAGLPPVATLLSLVAVLFLTTLLEPLFLSTALPTAG